MADVFVLGGGTLPPPSSDPAVQKPLIIEPRNPRNNRPKFQAEFQVGGLLTEPRR